MRSPVELSQELRGALGERPVHFQAGVRPTPNPVAVVQVGLGGRAVASVRLVIAAAGAERPRPTRCAIGLVRDVMLGEKVILTRVIDAVEHGAELVRVRAREAMTERHVTVSRDPHESNPGTARIRLAHSLVQLFERIADVRESVPPAGERRLEKIRRERLESAEQRLKAFVLNRVLSLPRCRDRREADLPEPDLLEEMLVDRDDVEVLSGERDARANRPPPMARQELLDVRDDDVVTPHPVRERTVLVLLLARAVDRHGDADVVL